MFSTFLRCRWMWMENGNGILLGLLVLGAVRGGVCT